MLTAGLEQVERTNRVDVEVLEGPRGGKIVTRLSRGVDQKPRLKLPDQIANSVTIANVELLKSERPAGSLQPLLIPSRIARRSEKFGAHIVVNTDDIPAPTVEVRHDFGPDESA
jgi:hypothetical protein